MTEDDQVDENIRSTFRTMIRQLQADADAIPDWLEAKAKVAQLEIFLAHSENIIGADNLEKFCLSVLTEMRRSIDCARSPRGRLELTEKRRSNLELRSILFAGLYERDGRIV